MKKSPIKILICVQHLAYAKALNKAIQTLVDTETEQVNFSAICNQNSGNNPDFILLDLSTIISDPFVSIGKVRQCYTASRLIILTFWDNPDLIEKLISCGASNIYLIGSDAADLFKILEQR